MFLFKALSQNYFAIDLGTNNTLVYQPHKGIVFDEPTSISFDVRQQQFFDFGLSSKMMFGKNPKNIEVLNPLSRGAICNLDVAKAYIKNLIKQIAKSSFLKPSIVVSVPSDLNLMERNAVIEAGKEGGARSVALLKDPFSAAVGCLQDISRPHGVLVLDIGAGVSEITLLSCNGIVMSKSLRIAGNDIDQAIVEYFKNTKRILISLGDAQRLKKEIGSAFLHDEKIVSLSVKNLISRMPEFEHISSVDVHKAIMPVVDRIVALGHDMISALPPAFVMDIYDHGILLTGGSCMLHDMDSYISNRLNITVNPVENPLQNIILGAGRIMEDKRYNSLLTTHA